MAQARAREPADMGITVSEPDTRLNYMINIALTEEFTLASGLAVVPSVP
jgi:hypothetical protein